MSGRRKAKSENDIIPNPTLADVAKLAGVSASTVSRALAGVGGIAPQTVERVRAVAKKIGYRAEMVRDGNGHTATLGLIVGNVASQFYSMLVQAIEDAALSQGYNIILCNSNYQAEREQKHLEILMEKGVDGLIVAPIETREPFMQSLVNKGVPIIQVDRCVEDLECDLVCSDSIRGAYDAVQFLLQQGYERIGILAGPRSHSTGRERLSGYVQALKQSDRPVDPNLIKIGDFRRESAYRLTLEFVDSDRPPDALFVSNLDMTKGTLLALRDRGVRTIGLVGWDEFEDASLMTPPLTTVEQPIRMMGATAADLLIRRIAEHVMHYEPVTIRLATRLIVRESTPPVGATTVEISDTAAGE